APAAVAENVPQREVKLSFATIAPPPGSIVLRGSRPDASVEFGMRSDELVANALLNLEYTPSPSLLPVQSQLKVYLNDELMGVLPVTKEQLGKKIRAQLPIDPLYITDFNRVRLEFVGHYRDVCENPASSTLWLDVGRESYLDLTYQSLKVNNDLSHFPVPFYDPRDNRPLKLPMIFPGSPAVTQQQAAAIVASWFGSKAGWRGQQFPVYFNELPDRNAIVFATNDKRPDFLRDHPPVKAPTIEMIDNPNDPYVKLLVIFGRDDNDLLLAAKGIAQGNILFRGSSVTVDGIKTLQPHQPYDAPNWVRTDRSVTFAELKTYEQQLQSSGLVPDAITVALNLPPDLYLLRANGIDMDLKYRYTMPPVKDSSRMDISLNDQFLQSFSLNSSQDVNKLILRLPVLQGLLDGKSEVTIPALRLGAVNQLRFDFQYMNPMPGGSIDNCITFQPVQNHVVIGDDSTIDFSKYYHFIALPDLRVFANAGFPYSRMADLSDTLVVVPKAPTQGQVATLLQALGGIGSQTGLAAINLQMTDDGNQIKNKDADLLLIGAIPSSLKDDTKINLLVEATKSWVKMPMRHYDLASIYPDDEARTPNTRTDITSSGPMAAVIGFQSPYNDQRSVVALLADSPRGNELLTNALNDSGKRAAMFGSVAVIRESGVNSLRVGDIYYVGHLPWFERIWFALSNHPILLAIFAAISIVLLAWVLWRMLRIISRRRLSLDDE
ncbi:cellulose synthase, partial [Klebsiella pneumoniae]